MVVEGMMPGNLEVTEDAHILSTAMIGGDLVARGDVRVIVDGMVGGTLIADGADVVLNGMAQRVRALGSGKISGRGMQGPLGGRM